MLHELTAVERIMLAGIQARERLLRLELGQLAADREFVLEQVAGRAGLPREGLGGAWRIDLQAGAVVAGEGEDGPQGEA